jgi:ankyrin repeat protein
VYNLLGVVKRVGIHQVINCLHIWRQTPLHLAVFNQSIETVVEILLKEGEGLKVNATTWEGITALDMARNGNEKIVQMFKKL